MNKKIKIAFIVLLMILIGLFVFVVHFQIFSSIFGPKIRIGSGTVSISTPFDKSLKIQEASFPNKICDIKNYGAKENDKSANTKAINDAIGDCTASGGGKVMIPDGKWLTGPIKLKSNINLYVAKNAELDFSTDFNDYLPVVFSRFEGIEYYNYSPPIYANDCTNVAISGEGIINGQADKSWWNLDILASQKKLYTMGHDNIPVEERVFGTPEAGLRPTFIEFVNCHVITIENVTLTNSPMWTIHPLYSDNVTINNIKIKTDPGKNTDGIAIDSTSNVLVENSQLNTGDDSIVLKSGRDNDGLRVNKPTQNIVVRNCRINETHAGIAIGSEVSGGVSNVYVENSAIDNSQYGIRLKSAPGRGGFIKNIWINNININNASIGAIQIDNLYQDSFSSDNQKLTKISDVYINNITAKKAKESINIRGTQDNFIESVILNNINIGSNNGPAVTYSKNLSMDKIKINSNRNPLFTLDNSVNAKIDNYDCLNVTKNCFLISGEKSSNIHIGNINQEKINFQGTDSSVLSK